jgi:small subunit ribosomal protein S8
MDPIADFITIIRNGYLAGKEVVTARQSQIKLDIAKLLKQEGFITDFDSDGRTITVDLRYLGKLPIIDGIKRISTSSVRVYSPWNKIPEPLSGAGTTIISTSQGLMTAKSARRARLGGEVICQIW